MKEQISITLDENLMKEIENKRGLIPRSRFIEDLIRDGLKIKEVNHEENNAD